MSRAAHGHAAAEVWGERRLATSPLCKPAQKGLPRPVRVPPMGDKAAKVEGLSRSYPAVTKKPALGRLHVNP